MQLLEFANNRQPRMDGCKAAEERLSELEQCSVELARSAGQSQAQTESIRKDRLRKASL